MQYILYAINLVLFCKTASDAKIFLSIVNRVRNRFELTVLFNEFAKGQTFFGIGDKAIENVQEFTYLCYQQKQENVFHWLLYRTSYNKVKWMCDIFTDHRVNMWARRKLLKVCVRSKFIHGIQAWYPNIK